MQKYFGYFENIIFQVKTNMATFGPLFEELGPLFISASGHTAIKPKL